MEKVLMEDKQKSPQGKGSTNKEGSIGRRIALFMVITLIVVLGAKAIYDAIHGYNLAMVNATEFKKRRKS